jgi:hypothetical protein
VPLSNFVPRGFGLVHHSIAILNHQVPNPKFTIRNFLIAVRGGERDRRGRRELPPRGARALHGEAVRREKAAPRRAAGGAAGAGGARAHELQLAALRTLAPPLRTQPTRLRAQIQPSGSAGVQDGPALAGVEGEPGFGRCFCLLALAGVEWNAPPSQKAIVIDTEEDKVRLSAAMTGAGNIQVSHPPPHPLVCTQLLCPACPLSLTAPPLPLTLASAGRARDRGVSCGQRCSGVGVQGDVHTSHPRLLRPLTNDWPPCSDGKLRIGLVEISGGR